MKLCDLLKSRAHYLELEFKKSGSAHHQNINCISEVRLLLAHSLNISLEQLIFDSAQDLVLDIAQEKIRKFNELIARRARLEPIAYIVGFKEFYSINFKVNNSVLIPRNDTEVLVDAVLAYIKLNFLANFKNDFDIKAKANVKNINLLQGKKKIKMLDLATGSGAIGLSLLKSIYEMQLTGKAKELMKNEMQNQEQTLEQECFREELGFLMPYVFLSDISKYAIEVAKENAELVLLEVKNMLSNNITTGGSQSIVDLKNTVKFIVSDWFSEIETMVFDYKKQSFRNSNKDYKDYLEDDSGFDIIVSNPPYIRTDEINHISKETLMYEPRIALFADEDYQKDGITKEAEGVFKNGISAYCRIAKDAKYFLKQDGIIFLEIGFNQKEDVKKIFLQEGYVFYKGFDDIEGRNRVVSFIKNQSSFS